MIKKLKLKFIIINMALVGVIMTVVFGAAVYLNCRAEVADVAEHLDSALQLHIRQHMAGSENGLSESTEEINRQLPIKIITVTVGEDGEILGVCEYGLSMDDEMLRQAVDHAIAASDPETVEMTRDSEMELLSICRDFMGKKLIAFTSSTALMGRIRNVSAIYSGCLILALVLLLFVSYLLAGMAIRPVERAWKQQKQFVTDASHDLKTPLTVILANTDILRGHKEETVESQLQWVNGTAEEAERMKELCEEMLELARSDDMTVRIEPYEVDLADMCQRICLQFEPVAFEKGVDIAVEIPDTLTLTTDGRVCVRIIHILLDNAIKYSKAGDRVCFALNKTRQGASLSFHNYGTAIPKEDLPHIFERFYRADKARAVGGHGLGLSIAKNLTESIDGKISVSSGEREGTTFTVCLKNM